MMVGSARAPHADARQCIHTVNYKCNLCIVVCTHARQNRGLNGVLKQMKSVFDK